LRSGAFFLEVIFYGATIQRASAYMLKPYRIVITAAANRVNEALFQNGLSGNLELIMARTTPINITAR
jgi:hypothetical protein